MKILFDQGTPEPLRRFLPDHEILTAYTTTLNKQTVIARSEATKQSSWIATARFAHLAMTNI